MMRKTIVCFGDSNTWGFAPELQPEDESYFGRYPEGVRWTSVLQEMLGTGYRIIEEGLNARTSIWDDVTWPDRNGLTYLRPCLNTHAPVDLVILMLGTNDLKVRISGYTPEIARAAGVLVKAIQSGNDGPEGNAPKVLLVSPILVGEELETAAPDIYDELGRENARKNSKEFAKYFQAQAAQCNCYFLDAAKYAEPGPVDAIHLDAANHRKLAVAFAEKVREIFQESI
jgi:lysophospholipase L1-like esterase